MGGARMLTRGMHRPHRPHRPYRPPSHQLTDAAKNHHRDSNDNFSGDSCFLCYETREIIGPGIGNSQSVEKNEVRIGEKTMLYALAEVITSLDEWQTAPGACAAFARSPTGLAPWVPWAGVRFCAVLP